MKGVGYIFNYLHKTVGQTLSLIIALVFVISATYFSVEMPVKLGNSITALSNYSLVNQIREENDFASSEEASYLKDLNNDELKEVLANAQPDMDLDEIEDQTGLTVKELFFGDVKDYEEQFHETLRLFIINTVGTAISFLVFSLSMVYVSTIASKYMRGELFTKLQNLAIKFFDSSNDGDVLSRFTNDIDNVSNMINQAGVQLLSSVFLLVAVTYKMLKEQFNLGMIIIGLGLVLVVIMLLIVRQARKYVSVQQKKLGELNGYIDEKIAGQRIIITNGLEEEVIKDFEPFNDAYRNTSILGQTFSGMLAPTINGFRLLSIALIILFGSRMAINGVIQVGMLVTFIQFAQSFFQPFQQIAAQYSVVQLAVSGAERVGEILEETEDVVSSEDAKTLEPIKNSLTLKNLTFGYEEGNDVLKNVDIEVYANRMVALVGPTGSGKTTIMNLLNRFYNVEDDMIYYDDIDINNIDVGSLRKNVGIVLQDSVLFSGTLFENIAYGKPGATLDDVINVAKLANIHDYIMTLKDGYDTLVNEQSSVLSTGQKQLISIARTILTDPMLLILDEATSNVDTVTEERIQAAMDNVVKNRTSFVIAHRLKTILNADLILVLKDGEIIQHGNHKELVNQEGLYQELYTNQFVFE
ncbi:MAG: ABC transporter ATP-binding protein [Bacilli bacterium]